MRGGVEVKHARGKTCFVYSTLTIADETTNLSLMVTVNVLILMLHVSGSISIINHNMESNVQVS